MAWLTGQRLDPVADLDSNGFWPVRVEWKGAGTNASPLEYMRLYLNDRLRAEVHDIRDLIGGDGAGFASSYGAWFDNFRLASAVPRTVPAIEFAFEDANGRYKVADDSGNAEDSRLIENGRFFQRRLITGIKHSGRPGDGR